MSERDLKRVEILNEVLSGRWTAVRERPSWRSANAKRTGCWRETNRRWRRTHPQGPCSDVEPQRERWHPAVCGGFGEDQVRRLRTDAGGVLLEKHDLRVGRETLRWWMVAEGLWLSRQQRRTFHRPRLRRESYGELIQIDGSQHRWFEQRGEPCTLMVRPRKTS